MCGICGYIVTKKGKEDKAKLNVTHLLMEAEVRGDDATGIAYPTEKDGKKCVRWSKAALPAFKFVATKGYRECLKEANPTVLIGHCRAKTQGDPANNANNHPIIMDSGLALVHNGMIYNDKEIFAANKDIVRKGEVDSEIIAALIEYRLFNDCPNTIEAIQSVTKELRGTMTCAMVTAHEPDTLYLWASSNPLWLAYQLSTGTVFFASTKEILQYSLYKYRKHYDMFYVPSGIDDFYFKQVADNTGYKLTPKGPEEFKIERPALYSSRATYSSYGDKGWGLGDDYEGGYHKLPATTVAETKQETLLPSTEEDKKKVGTNGNGSSKSNHSNKIYTYKNKKHLVTNISPDVPIRKPGKYDTFSLEARSNWLLEKDGKLTVSEETELMRITGVLENREDWSMHQYTVN